MFSCIASMCTLFYLTNYIIKLMVYEYDDDDKESAVLKRNNEIPYSKVRIM